MKALRVNKLTDDFSGAAVENISIAPPQAGEVQVKIMAAAVNFPDVLMCRGGYQFKPALPFTPGMEASGRIIACGDNIAGWKINDEVSIGARLGLMAEKANLPPSAIRHKPPMMNWAEAASWQIAWMTAWVALIARGKLSAGETLLVLGAAGGVGLAAVEIGKMCGAKIIAVASSDEKRALVKNRGADIALAPSKDLPQQIKEANQGQGADVAYDPVGGDMFDIALRCLNWQGRLLVIGFASGRWPVLPVNYALIKGLSIIGVRAGEYRRRDPEQGRQAEAQIQTWAQQGKIKPHIGAQLPLSRAIDALKILHERRAIGKICIMMDDDG